MIDKTDVNFIIYLIKRTKEKNTDDFQIWNGTASYILNQLLRQIKIPKDNWYVTYKADTLWQQLTKDKMDSYKYKNKVTLTRNKELTVETYKGNSKKPSIRHLSQGDSFDFREVFHDEHIIPIKVIIDQLLKLDPINYDSVVDILSKISVCRMLKTEDRSIYNAYKRSFDVNEVIQTTYLNSKIYVKDYPYVHMSKNTKAELSSLDSIDLVIPKEAIVEFFSHPETYGYKMAFFPNGMYTDIYINDAGEYYSKTNDLELINYIMILQEVFAKTT